MRSREVENRSAVGVPSKVAGGGLDRKRASDERTASKRSTENAAGETGSQACVEVAVKRGAMRVQESGSTQATAR